MKYEICPRCKNIDCMCLPEGKTCLDCLHFQRCHFLISVIGTEKTCDWFPIRFRQQKAAEAAA